MNREEFELFMGRCQATQGNLVNNCTILQNMDTSQMVLLKEIETHHNEQFKTMCDTLLKQKQLYHDHLLSLIDFYACEEDLTICAFYEYSSHSLSQELEARALESKHFTNEELQNILVSVLKVLGYLEGEETGHGCLSPLDICLADGVIKVVDPSIASSSPFSLREGYYYSPELLSHIQGKEEEDPDIFKNDLFCLALCLLHCGLLEPCDDCIDYQEGTFNFDLLEEKVEKFHQIYGDRLVKILLHMLDENVDTRFTIEQLFEQIETVFDEQDQEQQISSRRESDFESSKVFPVLEQKCNEWSGLLSSKQSMASSQHSNGTGPIRNPLNQIRRQRKQMKIPMEVPYHTANIPPAFTKQKGKTEQPTLAMNRRQSNKENFSWQYRM